MTTICSDNQLYTRVGSLSQVAAGKWYFNPNTNSIYISDNPAGHTVEYSEIANLSYYNGATGVVFSNITVEKYANAAQQGVLHGVTGWTLSNDTFEWNHGTAVAIGAGSTIQGGHYVHNGQEGIAGYQSDGVVINGAEVAYNNWAGFNPDWDAGGIKMCTTANVTITNCNVHDNNGMGIWADIDSTNWTITGNTVTNNNGNGIMYEISHGPNAVDSNTVSGNARAGIYISNSDGVEASGNTVTVAAGNTGINGGIDIINDVRGSGPNGVYQSVNDIIRNNTIVHTNSGAEGRYLRLSVLAGTAQRHMEQQHLLCAECHGNVLALWYNRLYLDPSASEYALREYGERERWPAYFRTGGRHGHDWQRL
jgi:parallel beta-helix repeat protein